MLDKHNNNASRSFEGSTLEVMDDEGEGPVDFSQYETFGDNNNNEDDYHDK